MGKSAKSKAKRIAPADDSVPAQIAEALKAELGRLDSVIADLGERAVRFVTTGTPEAVLLEIGNHQQAVAQTLAQGWPYFAGADSQSVQEARKAVLLASGSLPIAVLHRIGRIFSAANPSSGTFRRSSRNDDGANWLRWLVLSTSQNVGDSWNRPSPQLYEIWGIARLAQCLAETGAAPSVLVHVLYGPKDYFWDNFAQAAPDLKDWLVANEALIASVADGLDSAGRTRLIDDLGRLDLADGLYQDLVFKAAVGTAKGPAAAARTALRSLPFDALVKQADRAFAAKDSATRRGAAEVLAQLGGPAARDMLLARKQAETAKPMQDAIAALIAQVDATAKPKTLRARDRPHRHGIARARERQRSELRSRGRVPPGSAVRRGAAFEACARARGARRGQALAPGPAVAGRRDDGDGSGGANSGRGSARVAGHVFQLGDAAEGAPGALLRAADVGTRKWPGAACAVLSCRGRVQRDGERAHVAGGRRTGPLDRPDTSARPVPVRYRRACRRAPEAAIEDRRRMRRARNAADRRRAPRAATGVCHRGNAERAAPEVL